MFSFVKQHKILCAVVACNLIVILIAVLVIVMHQTKTATIDVYAVPSNAIVELNGKRFENYTTNEVTPGEYHVKISADNLQVKEYDITIENGSFVRLWDYLVGENESFDYYIEHAEEVPALSRITDEKAKNFVAYYDKIAAIRDQLPLEYYERTDPANTFGVFIEESEKECHGYIVCLVVYGGERHRDIAMKLIKDAGFEPTNYQIEFEGGE